MKEKIKIEVEYIMFLKNGDTKQGLATAEGDRQVSGEDLLELYIEFMKRVLMDNHSRSNDIERHIFYTRGMDSLGRQRFFAMDDVETRIKVMLGVKKQIGDLFSTFKKGGEDV